MTAKLHTLRARLQRLKRRRASVRWVTAWSALALTVLWTLAALFLGDWLLSMSTPQRAIGLAITAGVSLWAFLHYTKPWLGRSEDLVDVALLVEKHQHIDSDLVAALQFQELEAAAWGSPQLETAVVDYVEDFTPGLNVHEGFTYRRFKKRLTLLAVTVAAVGLLVWLFPAYAKAFFNRLAMRNDRYPTRTTIEQVVINGTPVEIVGAPSVTIEQPYGEPLGIDVRAAGVLPESGRVALVNETSGAKVDLTLKQSEAEDATFHTELSRLSDSVSCTVYLGDTWTEPLRISVVPPPVVHVDLQPHPPAYADRDENADAIREGTRQIAVIEGSSVDVIVRCTNKELRRATLTAGDVDYPLVATSDRKRWELRGEMSPLFRVSEPTRYSIQVEDADGRRLEHPIEGFVRIRADRRPLLRNVSLGTVKVLPTAQQTVRYEATDDYGLSQVNLQLQIVRRNGEVEQRTEAVSSRDEAAPPLRLAGRYQLDLTPFKLAKGDEIKITLEAKDYRGKLEPRASLSEPLVMQVTDRQGIIAALGEGDEKAAEDLNTIIELGTGEKK